MPIDWTKEQDRRTYKPLTEKDIEHITDLAAEKAVKKLTAELYQHVGRSVVSRALFWIGAIFIGFALAKGWISFK